MANISISYSEMEESAARLGVGRDEITDQLSSLRSQIEALVSGGFVTDQASGRFSSAFLEYTASANTVIARLTEIQDFLLQTANAMRDMDAQIAARIA